MTTPPPRRAPDPAGEVAGGGGAPAAVLFDMDGTLVDTEKLWDAALHELAARLGGTLSRAARVQMIGATTRRSMWLLHQDLGLGPDGLEASGAWLETRVGELFAQGLVWRPGAAELLATVRAAGLPTALVTATRRDLVEIALDTLDRANFDVVVCGNDVTRPKPHPEPYLTATGLLGVVPAHCVAIEDSANGAASAEAAGCAVLVVPSEAPVPPGPRRVHRETLSGLTVPDLGAVAVQVGVASRTA